MIRISRMKGGKGNWLLESPWGGLTGELAEMFDGAHRIVNIQGEDRTITWRHFETELLEVYATGNEGGQVEVEEDDEIEGWEDDCGMFGEVQ